MSIQLTLDGHSFSSVLPPAAALAGQRLELELLAPKTMLVPAPLFAPDRAAALLAANGMAPDSGERVVWSSPGQQFVALFAVPADVLHPVEERFGSDYDLTTPLLHDPAVTTRTVWLCLRGGVLYIKVFDPDLQYAEAVPMAGEAEMRYLVERLSAEFPLGEYRLICAGDDIPMTRRAVGRYFAEVSCE